MLEQLLGTIPAVLEELKEDHRKVENLFDQYKNAKGQAKRSVAGRILNELDAHAAIEERLVYPAIRKSVEEHVIDEAFEEHHLVHMVIRELRRLTMGGRFDAKMTVLKELIQHHVKEEEDEVFPAAGKNKEIDWDNLQKRARQLREKSKKVGHAKAA